MTKPTLTQVFGANATQTSTTLTISKADLTSSSGLTASATNDAESLVVALILQWESYLNSTNLAANNDQQTDIEDSYQSIVTRNNVQFRQYSKTINMQVVDTSTTINPNSF